MLALKGITKTRRAKALMCLAVYLFLGLMGLQNVASASNALASAHNISVVADGDHLDIVLGHHHIDRHHHSHAHGHQYSHQVGETEEAPHHPDHVIHLSKHQEQTGAFAALPNTYNQNTISHYLSFHTEVAVPLQLFFERVSVQQLAHPPPLPESPLAFLKTVILTI